MDCNRCKEALQVFYLSNEPKIPEPEKSLIKAHLAVCPDCRAEAIVLQRMPKDPATIDAIAASLPDEMVQRVHNNVLAKIEAREGQKRQEVSRFFRRGIAFWASVSAAAFLVAIGTGWMLGGYAPGQRVGSSETTPGQPAKPIDVATPKPTERETGFPSADEPASSKGAYRLASELFDDARQEASAGSSVADSKLSDVMRLCRRLISRWPGSAEALEARRLIAGCHLQSGEPELARQECVAYVNALAEKETSEKAAEALLQRAEELWRQKDPDISGVDFKTIIALSEKLVARWPDSNEALASLKLVSRCYTQLGKQDKALTAFLVYASKVGEQTKRKALDSGVDEKIAQASADSATADTISGEANRLFAQQDYFSALPYYEFMITRYPETKFSDHAQFMTGRYFEKVNQPHEAIVAFREVIRNGGNNYIIRNAFSSLSQVSFNMGDQDQALGALKEMSDRFSTDEDRANAAFQSGMLFYASGKGHYPAALAKFGLVVSKHPDHHHARSAKAMIALIKNIVFDESVLEF